MAKWWGKGSVSAETNRKKNHCPGLAWPSDASSAPPGTVGKTVYQNSRRTLREAAARSIRRATIGELKRKFQADKRAYFAPRS